MSASYTFSIANDFPNAKVDPSSLAVEIGDSAITKALDHINTQADACYVWFKDVLTVEEQALLSSLVAAHQGDQIEELAQVEVTNPVTLLATNIRGKIEVHESSRIPFTRTYYTGCGDNPDVISDVGNGTQFISDHTIGQPMTQYLYLDFNIIENETWIHEGYMIWNQAKFDMITFEIVPRTVSGTVSSGTYFNVYGGYLVVPAAGDGTFQLLSDITQPHGGLVHIPFDYDGNRTAPCFWNATWNSTTKQFENITAAPFGDGMFNMFTVEVSLARFINKIPVIGNGFEMMQSADADQIGQGMRLRARLETSPPDHDWDVGCILTMHRARSI